MKKRRTTGYVVLPHGGYPDTSADYVFCNTRAEVASELVDYGYMKNPGVFVYVVSAGESAESVIEQLSTSPDPYPDYVVEYGPRGGVQWNRA